MQGYTLETLETSVQGTAAPSTVDAPGPANVSPSIPTVSSDAEALEAIIDRRGIRNVLECLMTICNCKAEHLRENWQDEPAAKAWEKVAKSLYRPAYVARDVN